MSTLEKIQEIAAKLTLTLDNPKSVKLQIKEIKFAQKQLKAIKQELNLEITKINQNATQSNPDSVFSVGLDILGKRKWAGKIRADTRRAIEKEKKAKRQPYIELKEQIDHLILEGDRLNLLAEKYLIESSK